MENQSPQPNEELDIENELEAAAEQTEPELIEDFSDDDIGNADAIQTRTVELESGVKRRVYVRRLTGAETIKTLRTLAKFGDKEPLGGSLYKLKTCLVKAPDNLEARFTDASALSLIEKSPASDLNSMLLAIHSVNSIIKNA